MIGEFGWHYVVYQPFEVTKRDLEKYDLLRCFAGGQGSLVMSDNLEVVKEMEDGFWGHFGMMKLTFVHILTLIVFYFVEGVPLRG